MSKGKVYIIGVGPGDYKLMTLKAVECIEKADVIVYDRLVGSKILSFAKTNAELIYVGKLPDCHAVPQEGINDILVQKALEGKIVARVKGGDPFVFGRGGEEAESLLSEGIAFEIVPGITSAIAVPAYAGIPVTHRDFCSSLHIITGHEKPGKEEGSIDYEVLAKLEGTLVFLMGVKNLEEITGNLSKFGKDKTTHAAVVEKGTTGEQRVVTGTLENIYEKVLAEGIKSPAVTVIGGVASLGDKLNWFRKGPLSGKRVVVTRAREQASVLVQKIEELGGEAVEIPVIKILPLQDFQQFDKVLDNIKEYQWMAFTSVNGVKAFFDRLREKRMDIRVLAGVRICAVGPATAEELEKLGLVADYVPESFTTEALGEGLVKLIQPGEKVLLARADIGSEEICKILKSVGVNFEDLTVYKTVIEAANKEEILNLFKDGKIDYITFTSSSTVKNFVEVIGRENVAYTGNSKVICIGPVTAKAAEDMGMRVAAVADAYTIDGLVKKLVEN